MIEFLMASKIGVMTEVIAGLCFIISALLFSNITGAVTGISLVDNRTLGFAFLCIGIAASFLFLWIGRRGR